MAIRWFFFITDWQPQEIGITSHQYDKELTESINVKVSQEIFYSIVHEVVEEIGVPASSLVSFIIPTLIVLLWVKTTYMVFTFTSEWASEPPSISFGRLSDLYVLVFCYTPVLSVNWLLVKFQLVVLILISCPFSLLNWAWIGSKSHYLILIFCHVEYPDFHWYISQEFECETSCIN